MLVSYPYDENSFCIEWSVEEADVKSVNKAQNFPFAIVPVEFTYIFVTNNLSLIMITANNPCREHLHLKLRIARGVETRCLLCACSTICSGDESSTHFHYTNFDNLFGFHSGLRGH